MSFFLFISQLDKAQVEEQIGENFSLRLGWNLLELLIQYGKIITCGY